MSGNEANAFYDRRVAWYRALDHVRKNPGNMLVEYKIGDPGLRRGEEIVDVRHEGSAFWSKRVILT